jgi:hypothetical protein
MGKQQGPGKSDLVRPINLQSIKDVIEETDPCAKRTKLTSILRMIPMFSDLHSCILRLLVNGPIKLQILNAGESV